MFFAPVRCSASLKLFRTLHVDHKLNYFSTRKKVFLDAIIEKCNLFHNRFVGGFGTCLGRAFEKINKTSNELVNEDLFDQMGKLLDVVYQGTIEGESLKKYAKN